MAYGRIDYSCVILYSLLNLLTRSTAKDHKTGIKDSNADFVIFFNFEYKCVLRLGVKMYACALSCPPGAKKCGVKQFFLSLRSRNCPHFQTPGAALGSHHWIRAYITS